MDIKKPEMISLSNNNLYIYIIDAGVGDCILIHQKLNNVRILIDSGPSKGLGKINVVKGLANILGDDTVIDLAIVTHNDDDHIGGFASLIANNKIKVSSFIFNDSSYINKVIKKNDIKYSLTQDIRLQQVIKDKSIVVNTFHNINDGKLTGFKFGDFSFDFLSPNEEKLSKYRNWIEKEEYRLKEKSKLSKADDNVIGLDTEFEKIISDIKIFDNFIEDDRPPNGSSLAFRLSIGTKKFLFLGDSHPTLICKEIGKLDSNDFDLCKLSHHGSERNTSLELLNKIDCSNFVICSDGRNSHGHPSLKTIARVIVSNPNANFIFSSNSSNIKDLVANLPISKKMSGLGYVRLVYDY